MRLTTISFCLLFSGCACFAQTSVPPTYPVQVIAQNSGKCLDVTGISTKAGAPLQQWTCLGGLNQQWTFLPQSDGSYEIQSLNSSMGLNVNGNSSANGANVVQWPLQQTSNMDWKLVPAKAAGTYQIQVKSTGDCLDVRGGVAATGNGVQIQQWPCTGNTNQAWQLVAESSVALNWDASTSSGVTGYYVYRATSAGGPYTKLSSALKDMSYVDGAVQSGKTYYYVTTATNGTQESAYSNQVQAAVPVP